ncbi:hypothetical protein GCM10011332_28860 [Terasakiella brassicae]|uniref:Uncharacterized protein n=1 Tax=Terasakiella brassicae TaxID=1634917 RepID=A0A917FFJ9_9PROT|nr:hypothetical protein [Terasakiella brassicae]GGF73100.1 hypothetical protein GCM10011332_28860 [Terasakiella brassicae]
MPTDKTEANLELERIEGLLLKTELLNLTPEIISQLQSRASELISDVLSSNSLAPFSSALNQNDSSAPQEKSQSKSIKMEDLKGVMEKIEDRFTKIETQQHFSQFPNFPNHVRGPEYMPRGGSLFIDDRNDWERALPFKR